MARSSLEGKWYGKVDEVRIVTGTSGTYRIEVVTELLRKEEFDEMLNDILALIRAPKSVEEI